MEVNEVQIFLKILFYLIMLAIVIKIKKIKISERRLFGGGSPIFIFLNSI